VSAGPRRIQLRRTKGWRKPPDAIVVARPTKWGNPYAVGDWVTITAFDGFSVEVPLAADEAVILYRELMLVRCATDFPHPEDRAYGQRWLDDLEGLRGHDLACWCQLDRPCHADVLLDLANP